MSLFPLPSEPHAFELGIVIHAVSQTGRNRFKGKNLKILNLLIIEIVGIVFGNHEKFKIPKT